MKKALISFGAIFILVILFRVGITLLNGDIPFMKSGPLPTTSITPKADIETISDKQIQAIEDMVAEKRSPMGEITETASKDKQVKPESIKKVYASRKIKIPKKSGMAKIITETTEETKGILNWVLATALSLVVYAMKKTIDLVFTILQSRIQQKATASGADGPK
jgi:hypothetical protein